MSRVKDFFGRILGHVAGKASAEAGIMEPSPAHGFGGRSKALPRIKSQRERGWGRERMDGKWMSPFDLWLMRLQMIRSKGLDGDEMFLRIYGQKKRA